MTKITTGDHALRSATKYTIIYQLDNEKHTKKKKTTTDDHELRSVISAVEDRMRRREEPNCDDHTAAIDDRRLTLQHPGSRKT